jgi:hypothetical protein
VPHLNYSKTVPDLQTAIEKHENEKILLSMTRSLRITKNPRNNLESVGNITQDNTNKKMKSNFIKDENEETFDGFSTSNSKNKNTKNSKNSKNTEIQLIPCFIAEPSRIDFLEYGIGDKMTQTLLLRNVSSVSRTLRVLPPRSERFFLSPLLYPSGKYVRTCAL